MGQNYSNHLNKESKTKQDKYKSHPISRKDIELGIKRYGVSLWINFLALSLLIHTMKGLEEIITRVH